MSGQQRTLVRDQCVHGRDIDDLAITAFAHVRYDVFADQISTPHVGMHLFVPFIGGQLLDSTRHGDTRIVEQNVDLFQSEPRPARSLCGPALRRSRRTPRQALYAPLRLFRRLRSSVSQPCEPTAPRQLPDRHKPGLHPPPDRSTHRLRQQPVPSNQTNYPYAFDISTTIPASCLLRTRMPTDAASPADYSRTPSVKNRLV